MSENPQLDLEIRFMGMVGLVVMMFTLSSATNRLPGSPAGLAGGLVPMVRVDLPHSKAELEAILGAPGSESREIVANRWAIIGFDFAPGWLVYLYFLSKLFPRIVPRMSHYELYVITLLAVVMLVDFVVLHRMTAVANSATFSEEEVRIIRGLSEAKWFALFLGTMVVDSIFVYSHITLRVGQIILVGACVLGQYGALYANPTWISEAVSIMFVALGGISVLLLWKPGYMHYL